MQVWTVVSANTVLIASGNLHAAQLQVVHHPQPELGHLGLLDPEARHVTCAVAAHAQRQVDRLVAHHAFVADLDA